MPSRKQIIAQMRAQLVAPTCRGDTEGLQTCGLLAVEWGQPAFVQSFKDGQCPQGLDDGCREQFRRSFLEALSKRYPKASAHDVEARCMAEVDCGPYDLLELKWLESHNARVMSATRRRLDELAEREAARKDRERAERERVESEQAAAQARMQAIVGVLRGLSEWARGHRSGCSNRFECDPGYACVMSSGASSGTCLKAN